MNLLKLAWKNILFKPLNSGLSILLFALGTGLISLLFLLENQIQNNFEKNLAGVDLVIGAKGSPLQLILCSMYHIDAPTGNIQIKDVKAFLNPAHPLIEKSLPLSLGDSFRGYRIVGTEATIVEWYDGEIAVGELFSHQFDVTLGHSVASKLGLSIGDQFKSSHGFMDDEGMEHDDAHDFKVVGILKPNGSVLDQLILTTAQTFWAVHGSELPNEDTSESNSDEPKDSSASVEMLDAEHDHDHAVHEEMAAGPVRDEDPEMEITSVLLKFKGRNFQALNMGRSINENTSMQAANPAIEINRLFNMMNSAEKALRLLAFTIIAVSGLSIFVSLYSSMKERKYELSLMRAVGASPSKIFSLIIGEGLMISILGLVLGLILSHTGMSLIAGFMEEDYRYNFSGLDFLHSEIYLAIAAIAIGFTAAFIPALEASRTDISETLSRN